MFRNSKFLLEIKTKDLKPSYFLFIWKFLEECESKNMIISIYVLFGSILAKSSNQKFPSEEK